MSETRLVVVTGVAGAGKTTVGQRLATRLGWTFVDADDFHPAANIRKMAAGEPLDDTDRAPWLNALRAWSDDFVDPEPPPTNGQRPGAVLACSALKRAYRRTLGLARPGVACAHLEGPRAVLEKRLRGRGGHFMPASLLDSQLATLEEPGAGALRLDIRHNPDALVQEVIAHFGLDAPSPVSTRRYTRVRRQAMTEFESLNVNGITLRVALAGDGPLVVLVHGWPELWYSWRHQIQPLVDAGFRVAVPDVRGYGGSSAPRDVEAYGMRTLVDDIDGLIQALGHKDAVLVGHDWGAPIVWHTALMRPERVRAVAGLSVPHLGRGGPLPPTQLLSMAYPERFFYILYFQQPERPEAEFGADVHDALRKVYFANSADSTPELRRAMRARTRTSGYLDGLFAPDPFPAWLTEDDVDVYAAAFAQSGFHGGIHRYRSMDADWHDLPELDSMRIEQPSLFIAGEHDSVLRYSPGQSLLDLMDPFYAELRGKVIIPGAGHWVQQEQPQAVNRTLLAFLAQVGEPRV